MASMKCARTDILSMGALPIPHILSTVPHTKFYTLGMSLTHLLETYARMPNPQISCIYTQKTKIERLGEVRGQAPLKLRPLHRNVMFAMENHFSLGI